MLSDSNSRGDRAPASNSLAAGRSLLNASLCGTGILPASAERLDNQCAY